MSHLLSVLNNTVETTFPSIFFQSFQIEMDTFTLSSPNFTDDQTEAVFEVSRVRNIWNVCHNSKETDLFVTCLY